MLLCTSVSDFQSKREMSWTGATTTCSDNPLACPLLKTLHLCRADQGTRLHSPLQEKGKCHRLRFKGELGAFPGQGTAVGVWPRTHKPCPGAQCAYIKLNCTVICKLLANVRNSLADNLHKSHPEVHKAWQQHYC